VAQIERLPADQRGEGVGYIGDPVIFVAVWEAFKPAIRFQQWTLPRTSSYSPQCPLLQPDSIAKVTVKDELATESRMDGRMLIPLCWVIG